MYIPESCNEYWNFRKCIGATPAMIMQHVFCFLPVLRKHYFSSRAARKYFLQFSAYITTETLYWTVVSRVAK